MSLFYFEKLKEYLTGPALTNEEKRELMVEMQTFFEVMRIKLKSNSPSLRYEAADEIAELKNLLEQRVQV